MEFVTVDGILKDLILLVELGLVVVLDEVGDRLANVLNLLVPVAKGSERDGVGGLVNGVGAVVPVQQPSNTLMLCGVAHESVARQFVEPIGGEGDGYASVLRVVKRGVLRGAEGRASSDGTTTRRPGAWEEVGIGDDLGKCGYGEKESYDEREAKHWESDLQRLG